MCSPPRDLLAFNDQAACSLAADVDSEFVIEGSHAEVTTSVGYSCARSQANSASST